MVQSTFLCTVISVFCHLAWLIRSSSVDPTCYFPDGGIALTYQPCNSTVDRDASVCCELSTSVCGTKGLCYGSNGYIYRGGCTDPSWKSSLCPTICSAVSTDRFAFLAPCMAGYVGGQFCCYDDRRNQDCCEENFELWAVGDINGAGIPFAPSIDKQSSNLNAVPPSSTSSSTSISAPLCSAVTPASSCTATTISVPALASAVPATISISSTSFTPQSFSGNFTAVGVGIGVPLGILLLLNILILGLFLFRERRHRINTQQLILDAIAAANEAREGKTQYRELSRELGHRRIGPEELDSRQIH